MNFSQFSPKNYVQIFARFPARFRQRLSEFRLVAYLAVLGPGIIAANAGNDASGIATYSTAGAGYGYTLLWAFLPMTISLIVAQEMCVRMGVVTGKGLADLIREQFGVRWTALVMLALLIANTGVIISEFVGIAQASELFGIPRFITVPVTAALIWWLVVKGTQKRVERVFLAMSLVFFRLYYFRFPSKTRLVGRGSGSCSAEFSFRYRVSFHGDGFNRHDHYTVYAGLRAVFGRRKRNERRRFAARSRRCDRRNDFRVFNRRFHRHFYCCYFNKQGVYEIDSAATAAESLAPVAGVYAKYLFGAGLFGAAMLAMGVLPLATAYSISEALGFEKGLSRSFREAPIFIGIFTALILVGSFVALLPGIPQIKLLLITQTINGILLPFLLVTIVLLSSNAEIMGAYANRLHFKIFAWFITIAISLLSLLLIGKTIVDMF
jgi:Mn2+/Fe2+ NRAMP family transporter